MNFNTTILAKTFVYLIPNGFSASSSIIILCVIIEDPLCTVIASELHQSVAAWPFCCYCLEEAKKGCTFVCQCLRSHHR